MGKILDGKALAKKQEEVLKKRVEMLIPKLGYSPILATIIVGDNPASITYVSMKARACERVGLGSNIVRLSSDTTTEELIDVISNLNNDPKVCGILLQHPVPRQIDEQKCFDTIDIEKDVDGVNTHSFGRFSMGIDAFKSATPLGIMNILKEYNIDVAGKNAVVVGRSAILGKPIAMLLLGADATVTIAHSKTKNLPDILKQADIIVGAVGKPNFIQKEWIKPGVILIDAGYNEGNVGDIDLENCKDISSYYTPVPGGVGPMTISALITQAVISAERNL